MIVVRYADDFVLGFQHRGEAERFLDALEERLATFGLALHPDKTRLIEFGRYAAERRVRRGQGKPESFNFLGFTHYCGRTQERKGFIVKRKTMAKRLRTKLREVKAMLQRCRHDPVAQQARWLSSVVRGYYNYHAVPGNYARLEAFRTQCVRYWLRALRRRSQRHRMTWARFAPLINRLIPKPKILHPFPSVRFDATHPR